MKKFAGLKLHLANSNVDLRNPAHVARLAEVFERANSLGLGIVIHLRTNLTDYGREDARIFIDSVLVEALGVPVQIAHVAGWGGYDEATDGALGAFADWLVDRTHSSDNVYFDVSAVVRPERGESKAAQDPAPAEQTWRLENRYARLVERLRQIGLDRVLFGTDWPDWTARAYISDLEHKLPLEERELQTLLTNRAPWLR